MRKFRSFFVQLVLSSDLSDRGKQCNIVCAQHPVSLPFHTMRLDKSSTTNGARSRGDCAEGVGGSLPVWKKSLQYSRGTWNPAAKALFSPFLLIARFSSCVIDLEKSSSSDCVGWEIIVLQIRSVLRVVKMIFVPGRIFGIVDDRIPDAIRRCGVGATGGSPTRVSCLLSSTIIALPDGVNIGLLTKPFVTPILNPRVMGPMDLGIFF